MKNFSIRLSRIYDTSIEYKMEDLQHILSNYLYRLPYPSQRQGNATQAFHVTVKKASEMSSCSFHIYNTAINKIIFLKITPVLLLQFSCV